ncbi:UNVERIFIED_CONTAM: hypothetical protein Slati_1132700 [Sesamum latifolium]|uniref:DDE Tnp4 domain-containing protein n=1 Tax=Sesamum latifolium TaxID=2727402 RepID=A0AAW2XF85_9LAMI
MRRPRRILALLAIQQLLVELTVALTILVNVIQYVKANRRRVPNVHRRRYSLKTRIPDQVRNLHRLVAFSDESCLRNLRMDRNAFDRLCYMLEETGWVKSTKNVTVPEQVAMFLSIISHHKKNCVVKHDFMRSRRTVSNHFYVVLHAVCKLHTVLLAKPTPIADDYLDPRWKWFKGCLGALDGTFIDVRVPEHEKGRYRTRKGRVAVNVLGVCNPNMQFIYVLSDWEGSAANSRVLRDAIHRDGGLRVPNGCAFIDRIFTITVMQVTIIYVTMVMQTLKGFLTPYSGVRYHLREWDRGKDGPRNKQELFNLKHSSARNVIERTFGLLKVRWGILRSQSFYPIDVQNKIIIVCCILHNFIRNEMPDDPLEREIPDAPVSEVETNVDCVLTIESNTVWSAWREDLASTMYAEWLGRV